MNVAATGETTQSSLAMHVVGKVLSAAIVIATVIVGLIVVRLYYLYPRTDDAYVRANSVGIAPHVSGPITELPIVDNQYVKQGDLLFIVDPRPYQATLDSAVAKLQLTELNIRALEDAIRTAQSDQVRLEADAAYAKQYLGRIEPLLSKHFVTANDVFNARSRYSAAEAAVEAAHSDVGKAKNQLGQYGDINALRKASEAAVYDAKLNVGYCYVRAPYNGWVTNLNIAEGQYANQGQYVVSLIDDRKWYVIANFREEFLVAHPTRHDRRGFHSRLSAPSFSRPRARPGLGALSAKRRDRRGPAADRSDAELGAPRAALPGAHRARGPRPEIPVQDGQHGGRDDPGFSRSGFSRADRSLIVALRRF